MLNAIDLRIGNWVNIPGEGLTQIHNGNNIDVVVLQGAEAIPITEELLLEMGFIKRDEKAIYDIKGNNFAYQLSNHRVTVYHPGNQYWHWLGTHIDYVHQLQNLFYCIVGYDLTLRGI